MTSVRARIFSTVDSVQVLMEDHQVSRHPLFIIVLATRRDSSVQVAQNLNKTLDVTCRELLAPLVWKVSAVESRSDPHPRKPQLSVILPIMSNGWTISHWECLGQKFQERSATRCQQTIAEWGGALLSYEGASLMEKVILTDQNKNNLQARLLMLGLLTVMAE